MFRIEKETDIVARPEHKPAHVGEEGVFQCPLVVLPQLLKTGHRCAFRLPHWTIRHSIPNMIKHPNSVVLKLLQAHHEFDFKTRWIQ